MKSLVWTFLCVLLISVTGCKPDAAIRRGAVIDAAPSRTDDGKPGNATPTTTPPTTDQTPPLKQVK